MKFLCYIPILSTLAFLMTGCVNPYAKFYTSGIGDMPAQSLPGYRACEGPVRLVPASRDIAGDVKELIRQGYAPVGHSSFSAAAGAISDDNVRSQAEKLGACRVLTSAQYSHTESGAMPLTVPNNSTSYTTANANAYGSGGYANASGSSTTTTYGTQTVMMPYSVARYDAGAIYFVKMKYRFGARFVSVPPEMTKQIGENGGLLIDVVIRGSPAYQADIFEGDVITAVNNKRLNAADNLELFNTLLDQSPGAGSIIDIWRKGENVKKNVNL